MKKSLIVLLVVSLVSNHVFSQIEEEIKIFQEEFGKGKREIVSEGMRLSQADSLKFWPIYESYETARKKLGKDRIALIMDYANSIESLTDAKADELVQRLFKNDEAFASLMKQYYGRVKSSLKAVQAAKFLQIETYIFTIVKGEIQDELPFIGQIEKMKVKQ